MILASITGNLTSDPELKVWPAKGDKKEEKYVSVRIASNPRFGKEATFVELKFRRPFEMGVAQNMSKGEPIVAYGELTEKEDKKGKLWKEVYDATFQVLPKKKEGKNVAAPAGADPNDDDDDLDESVGEDELDDEDLPL